MLALVPVHGVPVAVALVGSAALAQGVLLLRRGGRRLVCKKGADARIDTRKLRGHAVDVDKGILTGVRCCGATLVVIISRPSGLRTEIKIPNMLCKFPGVASSNSFFGSDKVSLYGVSSG